MKGARGFTLIELILVFLILGVLSYFAITSWHAAETMRIQFMADCVKTSSPADCTAKWQRAR